MSELTNLQKREVYQRMIDAWMLESFNCEISIRIHQKINNPDQVKSFTTQMTKAETAIAYLQAELEQLPE